MKRKTGIIIVVIFILVIIIYNLPYFKELRAYEKTKRSNDITLCDEYLYEYPNGRHADDVMFLKIGLSNNHMDVIVEYLNNFPDGKYSEEVNTLCDSLWNEEIDKYNKRDKSGESEKATKYMSEMLQYMKEHRINTILVNIHPNLNLKDYDEYDQNIHKILELINDNSLSIEKGMISLKSNFSNYDNLELMKILIYGVQESINTMFTPDFISVINETQREHVDMPNLDFYYTINSQEEKYGNIVVPEIWEYQDFLSGKTLNYLVGIDIDFKAKFSIPGSTITYEYSDKGEPGDNINNVSNIRDGYKQMAQICFAQFSNKMSKNLGLAETYFQEDEE